MGDPKGKRLREEAMRQIERKQKELLPPERRSRWRLDVSMPLLVVQALVMMGLGLVVGGVSYLLYTLFFVR